MFWFVRQQAPISVGRAMLAGLGASSAIALLLSAGKLSDLPLVMAPFGASCVLLFTAADSPLSQPANVVGGHLLSTLVGLLFQTTLGSSPESMAFATGTAITLMRWLRVTHPPAGADPMVVLAGQESFSFLLFPVLPGTLLLVCFTSLYNHFLFGGRVSYPHPLSPIPVNTEPSRARVDPPR
jgi:CBS-domain-containing membrane protein